jgi:hypothetical protein
MKIKYGSEIQRPTDTIISVKHTGIYIGNGEVIHFNVDSSTGGDPETVEKCSLEEFAQGKEVTIREEPHNEEHGNKIVKRAKKIMRNANNKYNNNYGLFFGKNCEDFTEDCFVNA